MYTALPCEARPLVDHFKLKKDTTIHPFDVYVHQDICLTVTGLGKCAMAAGVAYSQALFSAVENPVMLNIGIAGHRDHELGRVFLIDKIMDYDSGKSHYPPLVFMPVCPTEAIQTASSPQLGYDQPYLCDMEASAFYETATRFSSAELTHCLKVISDNRMSPANKLKPQQVSALIGAQIPAVEAILSELIRLADLSRAHEPRLMTALTQRYRFTASERAQLRQQLSRWDCLTGHQNLEIDRAEFHNSKDILNWLEQQISQIEFYL